MTAAGWHLSFRRKSHRPTIGRDFASGRRRKARSPLPSRAGRTEPMTRSADGWFEAELNCGAGTRYRYVLQDGTAVPDPASRAQSGDIHGFSVVVDPSHYQWRHPEWQGRPWTEAIIYELHAGLLGGYAGVARELPRLAALGITAIELMPIAEFPGTRNWGYDGALPFAPECSYGTPEDLKALVDAAHDRGLSIFLDVVYNHFGPDGNYLSLYAPQFFRDDVATPWGPAIDFRRKEVRRFFTDNALYWLNEYRFDGLRFDAVHAITETDWLEEMAAAVRKSIAPGPASPSGARERQQRRGASRRAVRRAVERRRPSRLARAADRRARRLLRRLRARSRTASGALSQGRICLSGRGVKASRRQAQRHAERQPAAHGFRVVPAESRSDRQSRLRRTADRARRSKGAGSRDRFATPLPANPAAVHGRGDSRRSRRFCFLPTTMRNSPKRFAKDGAASSRAFRNSPIRRFWQSSPIRTRFRRSTARSPSRTRTEDVEREAAL